MRLSLGTYVVGSTALTSLVIAYAFHLRQQFYPTALYLTTSKPCLMVLGNAGIMLALLFGKLLVKIFLGSLKETEVEHLNDRISSTVMDSLLAMTIFRDDFDAKFVALFVMLLFAKVFHWVAGDRVDFMEHSPANRRLPYVRVLSLLLFLLAGNMTMMVFAYYSTLSRGPSVMLLFGFEYGVLTATALAIIVKFFFNLYDILLGGRWERKSVCVLYLDFVSDMIRLGLYLVFFSIVMMYYGMPLHIIRHLYTTFRSVHRRVKDILQYRKATGNMNQRFPDATAEELARTDGVCIVCREELLSGKKLPCGHILHIHCLRSWLERQQTCPTCRVSVIAEDRPPAAPAVAQEGPAAAAAAAAAAPNNQQPFPQMPGLWMQVPNAPPQFIPFLPFPPQQQQPEASNVQNNPSSSSSSSTTSKDYNPLKEIELLRDQLNSAQSRLDQLYLYLSKSTPSSPSSSTTTPSTITTTTTTASDDEEQEDELLERAIRESLTTERQLPQDDPSNESAESLRKRRILRFSSN